MYLIECLNNEKTKNCSIIYNNKTELKFSTSLEDVALIEDKQGNSTELTNGLETYVLDYESCLLSDWGIK